METVPYKKKIIDLLIVICAYLVCASFPFALFIKGTWLIKTLQIAMQVVFCVFWWFFTSKSNLTRCKIKTNLKNYLLILPCFLVFGSNFLYAAIKPSDYVGPNTFTWVYALDFILTFLTVANEEYLFRYLVFGNLDPIKKPLLKVIVGAGIFGICHIGRFLNSLNPADLIVVLYTFGLGLVLGALYVWGGAPATCICLHLLFNLVNGVIFDMTFAVTDYLTYILVNCGVALFFAIYLLIIYFVRLRHECVYNVRGELI